MEAKPIPDAPIVPYNELFYSHVLAFFVVSLLLLLLSLQQSSHPFPVLMP
jgi:hypothetical protein